MSPILFSLFSNELARDIISDGVDDISFSPNEIDRFILLFASDLAPLSTLVTGVRNQLSVLYTASCCLHFSVSYLVFRINLDKSWCAKSA